MENKRRQCFDIPVNALPVIRLLIFFLFSFSAISTFGSSEANVKEKIASFKHTFKSDAHDTLRVQALLDWNHYIYQSDVELSINLMNQIISICQTNLNLPSETLSERQRRYYNMAMAMSFRHLGKLYRSKGHYSKALTFANESLKVFERIDNEALVTGSMSEIGVIHSLKGDFASAIQIFTKNLKRKEEIDDRAGVAYSLTDIGYIYARIEDYEKAREYFQESLVLREKYCAPVHVAGGYFNMGYVSTALGDFSKAMKYHNKALDLRREIGNKYYIAASLNAIGDIHKKQKDLSEALKHYKKSVELYEELGEDLSLASCLNNIGEVHRLRGEFLSAIRFNQKALDLTRGSEELDAIKESYYSLYLSYKKLGKPLMAFTMFEKFNVYSDSILRKEDQRAVIRQEFAYQYEKQSLADSLRIAEAQQLADAQYAAQRAESIQERQKVIFIAFSLLLLLCLSGFIFYKRRKELQEKLDCEHKEANRLKELDQFKSKLYTNLTHEFRTPLTVILGMSERLQKEPQKFIQEGTQIIERNGKNLLRIINQLLDLSKMENHSLQLQLQNSDMIAYLRYITESFSAYANGKNIALRFHSSEEHLLMDYDSEQIMQVMTNLLSNALKFTPSGGGVMIRVAKKQSDLEIRVSDNGIGIPKQALSQIFKRFYQVDDSITRGYEGTGIGLAHTKELIHLMEGQIEVESIYRQDVVDQVSGTTFIIRLPIKSSAPAMENHSVLAPNNANSTKEVPLPVPGASITNQNLPKLLVIEDNPDVVFYLRSCLENDYQLEVAYNGKVGLEKAFEVVPDLIVSDIMMPEKDGIEVCDILKNDERTSHIPVVLLTAKADLNSRLQGLRRGADAHLAKPFQKEELLIRLQQLLEGRRKMRLHFSKQFSTTENGGSDNASLEKELHFEVEDAFLQKVNAILEANIQDERFGLAKLREKVGMARTPFFRKMKALTNIAPSDYIRIYRLQKAKYLLEHTDHNVAESAFAVGFSCPSYFSKMFQKEYKVKPGALKRSILKV